MGILQHKKGGPANVAQAVQVGQKWAKVGQFSSSWAKKSGPLLRLWCAYGPKNVAQTGPKWHFFRPVGQGGPIHKSPLGQNVAQR